MDVKLDDLDFNNMKGSSHNKSIQENPMDEILQFLEEKPINSSEKKIDYNSYEAVCERLRNHCDRRWICYPYRNKEKLTNTFIIKELEKASDQEFYSWVEYLLPYSQNNGSKPSLYNSRTSRIQAHEFISLFYGKIKFPSMADLMPVLKLEKKKKKKK